ncbi:MAG: polyamine aminopropyltransferase [Chloroflexi bacterium]|nr:polyamine aminopropyltransferase [Chloroflexota bacterium]
MADQDDRIWHREQITPDLLQLERLEEVVFSGKTPYQSVEIVDTACFGRTLVLDGKTQSSEADEFVYHEALVHPSLISHPHPQQVFIAGGGEGATAREVLAHGSVSRVVMVDIDQQVVELCRRFLPNHHRGAFEDPRLELHHADAIKFLRETNNTFDIIILDIADPLEGGPAYLLFTKEFFHLIKERLTPQGMVTVQAGHTGPTLYKQCFPAVVKTLESVFAQVYPYEAFVQSFCSEWGFVIGSLGPNPTELTTDEIDRRIALRLQHKLRFYDGVTHRGMFSLPKYLRKGIEEETRLITEQQPLFVP